MNIRMIIPLLISLTSVMVLTSCATSGTNKLAQGGDMTMADIYNQKTGGAVGTESDLSSVKNQLNGMKGATNQIVINPSAYERSSSINRQFKQMDNPQIGLYVFAHIVSSEGDQEPVPGYTTAFFMYKKNNFALPSEQY